MRNTTISLVSLLALTAGASAATIYVDVDATGTNDGSSWQNARTDLSPAVAGAAAGDEIWVAKGTYPGTVTLADHVQVFGGFGGTETSAAQSQPLVNLTYITGQDTNRAVSGLDLANDTVLRGFHIVSGKVTDIVQYGAGLRLENSSAVVINCVFEQNDSSTIGGALAVEGGSPTFISCRFSSNTAGWAGAAAAMFDSATPAFHNCLFEGNTSMEGGAVTNFLGTPTFVNCTLANNSATVGGGGAMSDYTKSAVFRNSIVWGNTAARPGTDAFYHTAGATGDLTVTYSNIQDSVFPGTGNISADPLFVNAASDFRLQSTSPSVDSGDGTVVAADSQDADLDGDTTEATPDLDIDDRIERGDDTCAVDMGPYEADGCCDDGDCAAPTSVCDPSTGTCVGCVDNGDCSGQASVCDPTTQTCVACVQHTDCAPSGEVCCNNACFVGTCCNNHDCSGPFAPCCNGHTCGMCGR